MNKEIMKAVGDIEKRLDLLEETMLWLIRPADRFKVNQRVRLSEYADRKRIKFNKGVRTGKVTGISPFGSINVLVDAVDKELALFVLFAVIAA